MKRFVRLCVLSGFLTLAPESDLAADGFGVYTNGARAAGMGGAWVARVMDPSAVFYNVAGMTQLTGTQLYGGFSALMVSGNSVTLFGGSEFDADDETFFLPHGYLTHEISDQFAVGVGAFTPYGLGTGWVDSDFPGRFRSYDADIRTLYIQPSVAYAPTPAFSIGAGVDFVIADVELKRQADLSRLVLPGTPGTTFGQATGLPPNGVGFLDSQLKADATAWGFAVGALFKPHPAVQLGVSYRSQVTVDFDGEATFQQLPTGIVLGAGNPLGAPPGTQLDDLLAPGIPVDQNATTEVTMPDQLVAGVSVTPTDRWMVNADVKWTNWKDFDTVNIEFENANPPTSVIEPRYENGTSFRIGTEYLVSPSVALRAGYIRDETPAPESAVTPLLPDSDRNEFSLGLGYTTGPWQFDAYGLAEFFVDRDGPVGGDDDIPDGTYDTKALLFGLDFGYRF
jgi:long-chain fatty acid transport protein